MNCLHCNSPTKNPKYCSRSCSAKTNNKNPNIRRQLEGSCKTCTKPIHSYHTYCKTCWENRPKAVDNQTTLADTATYEKPQNYRRHARVRNNSRRVYLQAHPNPVCEHCGYSTYVEVCHIKPIAEFPKTALVNEINSLDNLVGLCPNHHYEFDKGLIQLSRT